MPLENKPFLLPGESSHACLLLHGLGGGPYEMQFLGERLNQQELTVQGVVYPGHDQSGRMPHSHWKDWYAHSLDAYQSLAQTYESVSVVGFSTGCPLGLYLASEQPVHKLVMLAPYFRLRSRRRYVLSPEFLIKTVGRFVTELPRRGLPIFERQMRQQAFSILSYQTFNIASVRSAMDLISQVKPRLSRIRNPVLIIQPQQDTVVDPAGASYLYAHIGSTHKKIYWLENSNHIITLDHERMQVYDTVSDFLRD